MTGQIIIDVIGWAGSVAVVSAYALLANHKLDSHSGLYHLLNLAGGVALVVNTIYYGAFPSTFVNVVWAVIAILALSRVGFKAFGAVKPAPPSPQTASVNSNDPRKVGREL